jgi:hypothetical protein
MRSAQVYISPITLRDAKTAAMLAGMETPDEWADFTLRKALDAIPALNDLRERVQRATAAAKREWEKENPST